MFGHTHPTLLRLEQVALQMRLLLRNPMEHFAVQACEAFREAYGSDFNENAFESTVSFFRHSHYLAIRPVFPDTYRVSYVGVHSSTGKLVVFHSRRNPYPEYLPDEVVDAMKVHSPNATRLTDQKWAALNALNFLLLET